MIFARHLIAAPNAARCRARRRWNDRCHANERLTLNSAELVICRVPIAAIAPAHRASGSGRRDRRLHRMCPRLHHRRARH
jgi:hypothetical protein